VRVRVDGAAEEVWENLKTDGFVESHPNVAKDATLGWGTRLPVESHFSTSFRPAAVTMVNVPSVPGFRPRVSSRVSSKRSLDGAPSRVGAMVRPGHPPEGKG
jgi:hypothetical protein